ncbi:MAG: hypothetical protein KJP21_02560 [Bacteroidia bacterium]|nr:hypothetical protein [Bacteroidia bacterium]
MTSRFFLFGFLFFLGLVSSAQYTQIGDGGLESNLYGPFTTNSASQYFSRYAYIYPSASFSDLDHGDTLTALAFKTAINNGLSGSTNLRIFVKSSSQSQFGSGALNWLAETRNGMMEVFNGSPNAFINSKPGFSLFPFNQGNGFRFDTTGGANHLQILIEYTQQASQESLDWYCENSQTVPQFVSINECKYVRGTGSPDSICTSNTSTKPTIRLFYPRNNNDLEVNEIQCFHERPVLMEQSDSIKVLVRNIGKESIIGSEAYLSASGTHNYSDTVSIPSLASLESAEIVFAKKSSKKVGAETLVVSLSSDDESENSTNSITRQVTYNTYAYSQQNQSSNNLGFTNQRGVIVAKFYSTASNEIAFVDVEFNSVGQLFQLEVYEEQATAELPGNLIYQSDTLSTINGSNRVEISSTLLVSGNFYVGVRQVDSQNFFLASKPEEPLISNSFYFLHPYADSVWLDLSSWINQRVAIRPSVITGNDLFVSVIDIPSANDTFFYSKTDSIAIEATVINQGYLPQINANVRLDILNQFNQVVFTSIRTINILSGDTAYLQFDKLSRNRSGMFKARVTSLSVFDLYEENSVLDSIFYIVKEHDYSANYIFEPLPADTFEVNLEGFWPRVRVFNYGSNEETDVPVYVQLVKNGVVHYEDSMLVSLKPEFSQIVSFDSITVREIGNLEFRVFSILDSDSFPENDTVRTTLFGRASDDLEVDSFIVPYSLKSIRLIQVFNLKLG